MMSTLLISAAGVAKSYAAKKAMDYAGKGLWKYFFFIDYRARLNSIIVETTREFEKSNPRPEGEKSPFYCFQIFFESLTTYVFFKKGSIKDVMEDMKRDSRILIPTQEQLDKFYSIFYEKVEKDKKLKTTYIEENFKEQIFLISEKLNEVKEIVVGIDKKIDKLNQTLEKGKLTEEVVLKSLEDQVNAQLRIQINSKKYLRDTFIEIGNTKDYLRYLCDPIFFSEKIFEEIKNLDFRYFNKLLFKKTGETFSLEFDEFLSNAEPLNVNNTTTVLNSAFELLTSKKEEITSKSLGYGYDNKVRDSIDDISFLKSQVILITETAGQGKTNFLCDFVEFFLQRRNLPVIFLTGAEIKSDDIRKSILKKIFPDRSNIEFSELMEVLSEYCSREKKFFVIVIDGINENINTREFSKSLEAFIAEIIRKDYIRVVISCRSEYYEDNFSNFENSAFSDELKIIKSLVRKNNDKNIKDKLFNAYIDHFNVDYDTISLDIKDQLTSNFLLFRIFCETFEGKELKHIDNIYKEELFQNYYNKKIDEINKRLEDEDLHVKGKYDIKSFVIKILELMVDRKTYINIPLEDIVNDNTLRPVFIRFLDENILLRRDNGVEDSLFEKSQVVNFTFDEFRDFLISKYLIEVVYNNNVEDFTTFLREELTKDSPIMEGCSTFLFYMYRRTGDEVLKDIIQSQEWFDKVFSIGVFNLKDDEINLEDKEFLKNMWLNKKGLKRNVVVSLLNRRDNKIYKNLNIDFLFDVIIELEETEYQDNFSELFNNRSSRYNSINQDRLLRFAEEKLLDEEVSEAGHKLFELLLYMFTNDNRFGIMSIYERYHYKYKEFSLLQIKRALNSKNVKLVNAINIFMERYGIKL